MLFFKKKITVGGYAYTIFGPDGGWFRISRSAAAKWYTLAKNHPELIAKGWTISREWEMATVDACPWCGARPDGIDYDYDGAFRTADCGYKQCREGRDRLDFCFYGEQCGKDHDINGEHRIRLNA